MKSHCLILLSLFLFTQSSKAISLTGGQLTYEWQSDSTYQFHLILYSPCDSPIAILPGNTQLCYYSSCGPSGNIPMVQVLVSAGGNPAAFKEYHYDGLFTLPVRCNDWTFYISIPAWNDSRNLQSSTTSSLYLEATLNNNGPTQFSSPLFSNPPEVLFDLNGALNYNPGLTDPNGDSLYVESVQPTTKTENFYNSSNCSNISATPIPSQSVAFNSYSNPFSTNNSFSLNASTGLINFIPDTAAYGYNTIVLSVKKYRAGILLGSITRTEQVRIRPFNPAAMTTSFPLNPIGFQVPVSMTSSGVACVGHPFSFDIHVVQPPGQLLGYYISTNATSIFPNSLLNIAGGSQGAIASYFYTPTIADTGLHAFLFTVDSYTYPSCLLADTFNLKQYFLAVIMIDTCALSAPSLSNINEVWLYPNPTRGYVTVKAPGVLSATVITTDGRPALTRKNAADFDLSPLSPGLYFIHLTDEKGRLVKREKVVKL